MADLHIGKSLNGFSMLEDQKYILGEILEIIDKEKPDGVLLAGDVYDKKMPPAEAVALFDDFLYALSERELMIFIISGNHDSPERLSFGGRIMEKSRVYISPVYGGEAMAVKMEDEYGPLTVYMLPFIKPSQARAFFPEENIETYTDAVRAAVKAMGVNSAQRNVLLAHQFVTGAETFKSEEINVGGLDNVDADVFKDFDYVALGHVHGPQNIGGDKRIRFCGTPLKYSFSEAKHVKSLTEVELKEKGSLSVRSLPLKPLHDMEEIRGTYQELTFKGYYEDTGLQKEYLHITLTDEEDIPDAMERLRSVYPYLMRLDYDNARTRKMAEEIKGFDGEEKSPLEIFEEFYTLQNNNSLSEEQKEILKPIFEKAWEENL